MEHKIQVRGGALDVIPGVRLVRINGFEQQHEYQVEPLPEDLGPLREASIQPWDNALELIPEGGFIDLVDLQQRHIQCTRTGSGALELHFASGGGVFTIDGERESYGLGLSKTPEPWLIFQTKLFVRLWQGHGGQWAADICYGWNWFDLSTFKCADLASEWVTRLRGGKENPFNFRELFLNTSNMATVPRTETATLQLPPTAQEEKPDEGFGLVVEAVGIGSGTGECEMADQDRLNSVCLGKRNTREKDHAREKRNKKTTGVRIEISWEDILRTKDMLLKDFCKASQS